jgi:hypothetical protein
MSTWRAKIGDTIGEITRLVIKGVLALNLLILAMGSVYVVFWFTFRFCQWCARVLFGSAW